MGDKVEMFSVAEVLGDRARQVPMSSIKGATGHMIGAAGAVEMVSSVLTLQHGVIPPTINHVTPDPDCVFDVVPNVPKRMPVNVVMSNSFGFGGQDASVIVKKYEE
jgi:3-oxoacyl-[acyl-carrier-protein] synthase II